MIPQQKSEQLIAKLNSFLRVRPTEIELARIRAEFNKIEAAGMYTQAQELRGILSAIEGDITSLEKYYQAALKSSGSDPEIRLSYATSLTNAHHLKKAVSVVDGLVDKYSDDIEVLNKFLLIYSTALNFKAANAILNKLQKLSLTHDINLSSVNINSMKLSEQILTENGVNWVDYCDRYLAVVNMLKSRNLKVYPHEAYTDSESINIDFPLDVSQNELINIDFAITETIAGLPYSPVDNCISFSCTILDNTNAIAA
jgi:tetratricopeptide (TPR) repeat protein